MRVWFVAFLCFLGISLRAGAPTFSRTNNETLRLPASADTSEYRTVSAFPGLKFEWPVAMTSPLGETNRLFIAEKAGYISVITNLATPSRSVFLDLTDLTSHEAEDAGLLGVAFHPGYRTNGFLYVFFTSIVDGGMRDCIGRFTVDPQNPNKALRDSYKLILFQPDTRQNHNGGDLHFGPDGYLYVSVGDPEKRNQQLYNLFSGMLRIDVDHRPGNLAPNPMRNVTTDYLIPADNPFVKATSLNGAPLDPLRVKRTEFWALGLRNPWRFCFDPVTGDLYCGDVGEKTWEEVNIIKKGKNYGWKLFEGPGVHDGFEPPIYAYRHDQGGSIIGGVVYRGAGNPDLYGAYVFGDYVSGRIWSLRYNKGVASDVRELCNYPAVICFGTDPQTGDVLVASADQTIRRLEHRSRPETPKIPARLSEVGAFRDLKNLVTYPGIEPYEVTVPFWSDHAEKKRWFMVPASQKIGFKLSENWSFPKGTVFVKHFDLETTRGDASTRRKIETRFLVITEESAYGLTYAWDDAQTDALLVPDEGLTKTISVTEAGQKRSQSWVYPRRTDCFACHNRQAGIVLGFNTAQLNRNVSCGNETVNQLEALSGGGYFSVPITNHALLPALAGLSETNKSLELRARSYLAANCTACHRRTGGSLGTWDARIETPLLSADIINDNFNPPFSFYRKVIIPGEPEHSDLLARLQGKHASRMPPLGSSVVDQRGVDLVTQWTLSLPRVPEKQIKTAAKNGVP